MVTARAIYQEIVVLDSEIGELNGMLVVTNDYMRNYSKNISEVRGDIEKRILELDSKRQELLETRYKKEENV